MKVISSLVFLTIINIVTAYDDADDTMDVEAWMKNPLEVRSLLDCYLDNIPCPKKYSVYRKHAEEAVDDACHECSSIQKHFTRIILREIERLYPEDYELLKTKYDKDGTHFTNLLNEVAQF